MKQPKFQPKTHFSKTNASIIRSLLVPRGKNGTTLEQLKGELIVLNCVKLCLIIDTHISNIG